MRTHSASSGRRLACVTPHLSVDLTSHSATTTNVFYSTSQIKNPIFSTMSTTAAANTPTINTTADPKVRVASLPGPFLGGPRLQSKRTLYWFLTVVSSISHHLFLSPSTLPTLLLFAFLPPHKQAVLVEAAPAEPVAEVATEPTATNPTDTPAEGSAETAPAAEPAVEAAAAVVAPEEAAAAEPAPAKTCCAEAECACPAPAAAEGVVAAPAEVAAVEVDMKDAEKVEETTVEKAAPEDAAAGGKRTSPRGNNEKEGADSKKQAK
jgi:hypothetical protein